MKPPQIIVIDGLDHQYISVADVAGWLTHMAAADGVITTNERKVLTEFAEMFDLDPDELCKEACKTARGVELQEVEPLTPSRMKGLKFEKFVVKLLSRSKGFSLLSWRSDKTINHTYAQDAKLPDLEVQYKVGDKVCNILIECKFRSTWSDYGIDISEYLDRYLSAASERNCNLYIALGVGAMPYNPDKLYLIPSDLIPPDGILRKDELAPCLCPKSPAALSKRLLNHR